MRMNRTAKGWVVASIAASILAHVFVVPAQADSPFALRFAPGSDQLEIRDPETARTLKTVQDLLLRYSAKSSLSLIMVGEASCPGPDCTLLRHRVDMALSHLSANWPRSAGSFPFDRLLWQATPPVTTQSHKNQLEIFARPSAKANSDCGATVNLRASIFPLLLDGTTASVQLYAGYHEIPFQNASISILSLSESSVSLVKERGAEEREVIRLSHGREFVLDIAAIGGHEVRITLQPTEHLRESGRTIADQLIPWDGQITAGAAQPTQCQFVFQP